MITGSLAKRYAKALFELSDSPFDHDRFLRELEEFAAAMRVKDEEQNLQAIDMLRARHIPQAIRLGIVEALGRRLGLEERVVRFLKLLTQRGRITGIDLVARHYRDLVDTAQRRLRARLQLASPASQESVAGIKAALEQATGKTVILDVEIAPELIGGLVLHFGSLSLDRSIRRSLDELRTSFQPE